MHVLRRMSYFVILGIKIVRSHNRLFFSSYSRDQSGADWRDQFLQKLSARINVIPKMDKERVEKESEVRNRKLKTR